MVELGTAIMKSLREVLKIVIIFIYKFFESYK